MDIRIKIHSKNFVNYLKIMIEAQLITNNDFCKDTEKVLPTLKTEKFKSSINDNANCSLQLTYLSKYVA